MPQEGLPLIAFTAQGSLDAASTVDFCYYITML